MEEEEEALPVERHILEHRSTCSSAKDNTVKNHFKSFSKRYYGGISRKLDDIPLQEINSAVVGTFANYLAELPIKEHILQQYLSSLKIMLTHRFITAGLATPDILTNEQFGRIAATAKKMKVAQFSMLGQSISGKQDTATEADIKRLSAVNYWRQVPKFSNFYFFFLSCIYLCGRGLEVS